MKSNTRTILDLFDGKRRYVIPLFQRQYVWSFDKQWQPLWEDIERKAIERLKWKEKLAACPEEERLKIESESPSEHFLGAVVLDILRTFGNEVQAQLVIDGQQRLTTAQVFLAAFRDVAEKHGDTEYVNELKRYTLNTGVMSNTEVERYKLWPTHCDQLHFRRILDTGSLKALASDYPEVTKRHAAGAPLLVRAYAFFWRALDHFMTREEVSESLSVQPDIRARIQALFETFQNDLQVVSIELEGKDDPQVIFETLNARGEPLLPSDLLRNYLFWRASREKSKVDELYISYWRHFDTDFWKTEEKQGRLKRPRVDLFFFNLLELKTTAEVNLPRLFYEYKEWSEKIAKYKSVHDELQDIHRYSTVFEQLLKTEGNTKLSRFVAMLHTMDVKTIFPLVTKILADAELDDTELAAILDDLESYLVRRQVCGLTGKNYNKVFISWLSRLGEDGSVISLARLREIMLAEKSDTNVWPNDARFLQAWLNEPLYLRLKPASRLEFILRRLEIHKRTSHNEDVTINSALTIEHVLPQQWIENWPLADGTLGKTPEQRLIAPSPDSDKRDRVMQTIGNLTLLTGSLNSKLQNREFNVKVRDIEGYSLLALNGYFKKMVANSEEWDEAAIELRARILFNSAKMIWPFPDSTVV